jgi:hypothetical protein
MAPNWWPPTLLWSPEAWPWGVTLPATVNAAEPPGPPPGYCGSSTRGCGDCGEPTAGCCSWRRALPRATSDRSFSTATCGSAFPRKTWSGSSAELSGCGGGPLSSTTVADDGNYSSGDVDCGCSSGGVPPGWRPGGWGPTPTGVPLAFPRCGSCPDWPCCATPSCSFGGKLPNHC